MRLRLYDCRISRLPTVIGKCQTDIPEIANYVNTAQQRLLYAPEACDESWFGTWAEVRLNVSRAAPYITLPREIARLEAVTVCDRVIPVNNQFYEYLEFGNGRMQQHRRFHHAPHVRAAYTRNNAVLFTDVHGGAQLINCFPTDNADSQGTKRVLIQGLDQNGQQIYTNDGGQTILGEFVVLKMPFVTTQNQFTVVTGVQKDVTAGPVQIFQMSPTTGQQVLLSSMEPGELTADYRRYFFDHLPCGCCPTPNGPVPIPAQNCPAPQVTAIAKLELIPVVNDTDYLLFHNLEAIIQECQSVRFSEMDNAASKQQAALHHKEAVRLLNGELGHYLGVNTPAVMERSFGSARLEHQAIGTMI